MNVHPYTVFKHKSYSDAQQRTEKKLNSTQAVTSQILGQHQ